MMCKAPISAKKMSFKTSVSTSVTTAVARPAAKVTREVSCSAELPKKIATTLAAAAVFSTSLPLDASADVAGLTPCAKSKAFAKLEKKEIKVLTKRLKLYEPDSAPALAINDKIAKTQTRFKNYRSYGLLCGSDGLPHLIVDGDLNHLGEFVVPGIGFLYVAGWIGYAGRSYLMANRGIKKPAEKEIIIDVPQALGLMFTAGMWPLLAFNELKQGSLTEKAENITVSPR